MNLAGPDGTGERLKAKGEVQASPTPISPGEKCQFVRRALRLLQKTDAHPLTTLSLHYALILNLGEVVTQAEKTVSFDFNPLVKS